VNDPARLAALGEAAAALVETGMVVGLGSGSTAEAFVARLGRRVEQGLTVQGVPTRATPNNLPASCVFP